MRRSTLPELWHVVPNAVPGRLGHFRLGGFGVGRLYAGFLRVGFAGFVSGVGDGTFGTLLHHWRRRPPLSYVPFWGRLVGLR